MRPLWQVHLSFRVLQDALDKSSDKISHAVSLRFRMRDGWRPALPPQISGS